MTFLYATTIGLSTRDGINDVRGTSRLMGGNVTVLFFLFHFYSTSLFHRTITYTCYTCLSLFHAFVSLPPRLLVLFYFYFIFIIMLNHDDSVLFLFYRDSFTSINTQVVVTSNPS